MADEGSLEALRDLYSDLEALSESRLDVVDRLWNELAARIEDFRNLLDQKRKDEKSRAQLMTGKLRLFITLAVLTSGQGGSLSTMKSTTSTKTSANMPYNFPIPSTWTNSRPRNCFLLLPSSRMSLIVHHSSERLYNTSNGDCSC